LPDAECDSLSAVNTVPFAHGSVQAERPSVCKIEPPCIWTFYGSNPMNYKSFLTLLITSVIASSAQTHASPNSPLMPTDAKLSPPLITTIYKSLPTVTKDLTRLAGGPRTNNNNSMPGWGSTRNTRRNSQQTGTANSRWKLREDYQPQIFNINQDVILNKARTSDKEFHSRDSYIQGRGDVIVPPPTITPSD